MITSEEKRQILEDYKDWSGGWMPHEEPEHEVMLYLKVSLSTDFSGRRRKEVKEWLLQMNKDMELKDDNAQFQDMVI